MIPYNMLFLFLSAKLLQSTESSKKKTLLFGRFAKKTYFCAANGPIPNWKDGRVVDYIGLENRRTERYRGFESLSFRFAPSRVLTPGGSFT